MKSKTLQLDIKPLKEDDPTHPKQSESNLSTTNSMQGSGFKFDPPKMFQRKTSFKIFQRKERKSNLNEAKICYISPQKSDIFKKYSIYKENTSQLDSSVFTHNSSQMSCFEQNQKQTKSNKFHLDLNGSSSFLSSINNTLPEDGFLTPKNDTKNVIEKSLKKVSANKLRNQSFQGNQNIKNSFDNDFQILTKFNDLCSPISTKSIGNCFKNENRKSKISFQNEKQNFNRNQLLSIKDLKFQIEQLQIEKDSYKRSIYKLQNEKIQIEQSSKLFLQQIKSLQGRIDILNSQKLKFNGQIISLHQKLSFQTNFISMLQRDIECLRSEKETFQLSKKQFQCNEDYKKLYFELNQSFKYLSVENNILKIQLEDKKQDQIRFQKLEAINKKLSAKNKFLCKQVQYLERQNLQKKRSPRGNRVKHCSKDQQIKAFNYRKSQNFSQLGKIRETRCQSQIVSDNQSIQQMRNNLKKKDSWQQNDQEISTISNQSDLQLSFELSPEKSVYPRKSVQFAQSKVNNYKKNPNSHVN